MSSPYFFTGEDGCSQQGDEFPEGQGSISWPESGWKKDTKPEDRPRPTSDGDINLFVVRRRP